MGYDLLAARLRVAVTSYLNPNSYTQKEYFDDMYNAIFNSVIQMRAPSQGERIMQRTFMNYAQNAVSKATGNGGAAGGSSSGAALKTMKTSVLHQDLETLHRVLYQLLTSHLPTTLSSTSIIACRN